MTSPPLTIIMFVHHDDPQAATLCFFLGTVLVLHTPNFNYLSLINHLIITYLTILSSHFCICTWSTVMSQGLPSLFQPSSCPVLLYLSTGLHSLPSLFQSLYVHFWYLYISVSWVSFRSPCPLLYLYISPLVSTVSFSVSMSLLYQYVSPLVSTISLVSLHVHLYPCDCHVIERCDGTE